MDFALIKNIMKLMYLIFLIIFISNLKTALAFELNIFDGDYKKMLCIDHHKNSTSVLNEIDQISIAYNNDNRSVTITEPESDKSAIFNFDRIDKMSETKNLNFNQIMNDKVLTDEKKFPTLIRKVKVIEDEITIDLHVQRIALSKNNILLVEDVSRKEGISCYFKKIPVKKVQPREENDLEK